MFDFPGYSLQFLHRRVIYWMFRHIRLYMEDVCYSKISRSELWTRDRDAPGIANSVSREPIGILGYNWYISENQQGAPDDRKNITRRYSNEGMNLRTGKQLKLLTSHSLVDLTAQCFQLSLKLIPRYLACSCAPSSNCQTIIAYRRAAAVPSPTNIYNQIQILLGISRNQS